MEANYSLTVDGLVFISRTDGLLLLDGVEEAQDRWKRNFVGFLADFSLERGIGGCLTAFVIDGLFQSRPEIFDQPKGGNARRLGFLGTNLICCCKKARVSFSMWGYGQMGLEANGVWGRYD